MDTKRKQLSLSVDEIALAFCLINHADVGKSFLQSAYKDMPSFSMEDRLTSASHSLMARGFAKISERGVAVLDEAVELILHPLVKFSNMIQVTLGSLDGSGPEITNIYVGANGVFTALRVRMGVIYELTHAALGEIPGVVNQILDLPEQLSPFDEAGKPLFTIKMASIASSIGGQENSPVRLLRQTGIPESVAKALGNDMKAPRGRGSVVITNISSENYERKDRNEAGAGFLLLWGSFGWMFKFADASDQTVAQILPCNGSTIWSETLSLVGH